MAPFRCTVRGAAKRGEGAGWLPSASAAGREGMTAMTVFSSLCRGIARGETARLANLLEGRAVAAWRAGGSRPAEEAMERTTMSEKIRVLAWSEMTEPKAV